jgi:hypothetical protein
MHTLLISNELRKSKLNSGPLWGDTLHGVHPKRGGSIDGACHVSHWYWETPRIGMMFQDNGTMNGHSTLGWILQFSGGWGGHFSQCLSRNLRSIPNLTKTKHQTRRSCMNPKVINAPCQVHLCRKGSVILSSSWPSSSFEVVAHKVYCGSSGYFLHVCRNGQQ